MSARMQPVLRDELLDRRARLAGAIDAMGEDLRLAELLAEVDDALERMERGKYGLCEVCGDPIEPERLLANPLERFCLGDLTPGQQAALEQDLRLAAEIQRALLPRPELRLDGWELAYHYRPAGVVSGDYCDVVAGEGGEFLALLGDVSGKGVAASMLMSQLHAMFHALGTGPLSTCDLVGRASRVLCESTLPSHYATLVAARAKPTGEVELCNAGHLPVLLARPDGVVEVGATGIPLGLFANAAFTLHEARLGPGDALVLVTDGVSEARDPGGVEYGLERLRGLLGERAGASAGELVAACVADVTAFEGGAPPADDLTITVVRRLPA